MYRICRSLHDAHQKHSLNGQAFNQSTEKTNNYWAGFLTAEGWILTAKNASQVLSLKVMTGDRNHLECYRTF